MQVAEVAEVTPLLVAVQVVQVEVQVQVHTQL
jgi:hypothetical protein